MWNLRGLMYQEFVGSGMAAAGLLGVASAFG